MSEEDILRAVDASVNRDGGERHGSPALVARVVVFVVMLSCVVGLPVYLATWELEGPLNNEIEQLTPTEASMSIGWGMMLYFLALALVYVHRSITKGRDVFPCCSSRLREDRKTTFSGLRPDMPDAAEGEKEQEMSTMPRKRSSASRAAPRPQPAADAPPPESTGLQRFASVAAKKTARTLVSRLDILRGTLSESLMYEFVQFLLTCVTSTLFIVYAYHVELRVHGKGELAYELTFTDKNARLYQEVGERGAGASAGRSHARRSWSTRRRR